MERPTLLNAADLGRILVTLGTDDAADSRVAIWLTAYDVCGDLVVRAVDFADVVRHSANILHMADDTPDRGDANRDRLAIADALRAAADQIQAAIAASGPYDGAAPRALEADR